jgi:CheY-like chemotaxis protein
MLRILIVDDHADTLRWLQLHLEDVGHFVLSARDVREAEEILKTTQCDVLISDIGLPDGTGWDLMERTESSRPPVAIAMSGVGRNIETEKSYGVGYRHHLFKPFPLSYLDRLLDEAETEIGR